MQLLDIRNLNQEPDEEASSAHSPSSAGTNAPLDAREEPYAQSKESPDVTVAACEPEHAEEGEEEGVEGVGHGLDQAAVGAWGEDGVDDVAKDSVFSG